MLLEDPFLVAVVFAGDGAIIIFVVVVVVVFWCCRYCYPS